MTTTTGLCRACGSPKPPGPGRKLCDPCRSAAAEVQRVRRSEYARRYYAANGERMRARHRAWHRAHSTESAEHQRRWYENQKGTDALLARRLARHGLSVDDYYALLRAQDGVCAICGGVDEHRRLNVDHDHKTGEIRGLLCNGCNTGKLGGLGDSIERAEARAAYYELRAARMRSAIAYLKSPPARTVLDQAVN